MTNIEKAQAIYRLYQDSENNNRRQWLKNIKKDEDFVYGEQLTQDEKDDLAAAGMPNFTINRLLPVFDIAKYFITNKLPRYQAVGADGSDSDEAQMHGAMMEYGWYISKGRSLLSKVVSNVLSKSVGWFLIDIDPSMDKGKGEVVITSLRPEDVIPDPQSTDINANDAEYIIVKKLFSKNYLKGKFPKFARKIENIDTAFSRTNYSERDLDNTEITYEEDIITTIDSDINNPLIEYFLTFRRVWKTYVRVFVKNEIPKKELNLIKKEMRLEVKEKKQEFSIKIKEETIRLEEAVKAGQIIKERAEFELEKLQRSMTKELKDFINRLYSKLRSEANQTTEYNISKKEFEILKKDKLIADNIINSYEYQKPMMKRTETIGENLFISEEINDEEDYPLIMLPFLWTGTVNPISLVGPLKGKQRETNKSHQLVIHNANLGSNPRWMAVKGQIDDEDEWQEQGTTPNGILYWRDILGNGTPPQAVQPLPLNSAFFNIVQEAKNDLEYLSGISGSMQGMNQNSRETYRGMLANDEFGTRRIRQWIVNVFEPTLDQVGKVWMRKAQNFYKGHKVYLIVQPNASGDGYEQKRAESNVPLYNNYGKVVRRYNKIDSTRYNLRVISGSTMPINRWALLDEYWKYYEGKIIDDIAFRNETDIRGKKQIEERMSRMKQLENALRQADDEIKKLKGTQETLERQVVQKGIDVKIARMETEERAALLETKAQNKLAQKRIGDKTKNAIEELNNQVTEKE